VEAEIRARGLQGKFHLLGQYPVATMPYYFALADVMLLTLRRDPIFALTIPSKLQSYLACAKPIVAAADGEITRLLQISGAGVPCPSEDAAALADAVMTVFRMTPAERQEMGRKGKDFNEKHFQRERLLDSLDVWLRDVTGEPECAS
jgi:glycosyltransferase involved in cell wall biosynthesis